MTFCLETGLVVRASTERNSKMTRKVCGVVVLVIYLVSLRFILRIRSFCGFQTGFLNMLSQCGRTQAKIRKKRMRRHGACRFLLLFFWWCAVFAQLVLPTFVMVLDSFATARQTMERTATRRSSSSRLRRALNSTVCHHWCCMLAGWLFGRECDFMTCPSHICGRLIVQANT